jgi:ribosomal protein S18 acetylase RimI-like enzyme
MYEMAMRIRLLEETSMNAWPALETVTSDGWVLRFSGGYTRRANSVHPLAPGTRHLTDKVDEAERMYRARNLPTIFKLTTDSQPDGLESALIGRGYIEEARTAVHVADLAPSGEDIAVETEWSRARSWSDGFHHIGDIPTERRVLHDKILSSISLPTGFAWVEESGKIVGCGLGVVEGEWLGIFDVVVAPEARRRGSGKRLTRGVMAWGHRMGAKKAYLQVMSDNAPALALYSKLGFREAYAYWYRVKR